MSYTPGPRQAVPEYPSWLSPAMNDDESDLPMPEKTQDDTRDNTDVSRGAAKFDTGKVRVDLVPGEFIYAVAAVLTYGALKYDDWNWAKGLRKGRVMAAAGRHWIAYMMGEELDPESGLPHLWHMSTNLCMLISSELRGVAEEDRQEAIEAYYKAQKVLSGMKAPVPQ